MTITHTPGPWHWTASCPDGTMTTDDKGARIALWPPQGGTVEQCANARLIAAAPSMLRALQAVADYWAGGDVPAEIDAQMRAAIASATGADQ